MKKLKLLLLTFILTRSFATSVVNIADDTTISGVWNLNNSILRISAKISGIGTITNALIEANPFIQIFDTTVTIGSGCKIREFSIMWYGAKLALTDNSAQINKAINACKDRYNLYVPRGNWKTTNSLLVATYDSVNNRYLQTSLRMYGEASFWDNGLGSQITYTGDSYALGLQLNKGSEISNLRITGGFIPPGGLDTVYYGLTLATFQNRGVSGNGNGLWIDPYYGGNNSGSTGCKFHDLFIEKFNKLIKISNNSGTQNGEIMIFEHIQLGNAKIGVESSQPQEKGNILKGIYSWGNIFYLFNLVSGSNYKISEANIAGRCINIFNISQAGWFPLSISDIYAESFGSIGVISSLLPLNISNSNFDFRYKEYIGDRVVLATNSSLIKFDNTVFRYYGKVYPIKFTGAATFSNCTFSGNVTGNSPINIDYTNGINFLSSQIFKTQIYDTIRENSIKVSVKKFGHN